MNTIRRIIREGLEEFSIESSIKNSNLRELADEQMGLPKEFVGSDGVVYVFISGSFNENRNYLIGLYRSIDTNSTVKVGMEIECYLKYFDNKIYQEIVFSQPFVIDFNPIT